MAAKKARSKTRAALPPIRLTYEQRDEERRFALPKPEPYRSEWRRDSARVLHSPAFRRLQGKTQLFPGIESDFFRNRLTHSLEVGQVAKSIAIRLNSIDPFLDQRGRIDPHSSNSRAGSMI